MCGEKCVAEVVEALKVVEPDLLHEAPLTLPQEIGTFLKHLCCAIKLKGSDVRITAKVD